MEMEKITVKPRALFEAYIVEQQRTVGMEQGHTAQPGDYMLVGQDGSLHHFTKTEFEEMFERVQDDSEQPEPSEVTASGSDAGSSSEPPLNESHGANAPDDGKKPPETSEDEQGGDDGSPEKEQPPVTAENASGGENVATGAAASPERPEGVSEAKETTEQ